MSRFELGVRAVAAALLVWGAVGCATHDVSKRNDACNPDLVRPRKSNPLFWYRCRDSDTVLVFVHGGASDSLEAWQNTEALGFWGGRLLQKAFFVRSPLTDRTLYWPWIAAHDARLESASIATVGYFTGLFTGPYGVDAAAEEWFAYLRTPNPAAGRAVMDHRNILIIAHSAGAVVARYVLAKYRSAFAGKRIGLLLMASGGGGTKLVDDYAAVVTMLLHRFGRQLQTGSEFLRRLDDCFRDIRDSDEATRGFELFGREIAETAPYGTSACAGTGFLGMTHIVEPDKAMFHFPFADPITGLASLALDERRGGERVCFDHETLVRPTSQDDPRHAVLVEFYRKAFGERSSPRARHGDAQAWERLPPAEATFDYQRDVMLNAALLARREPLVCPSPLSR